MRATWLWTAVLLGAVTGCGEGRAIFTVDVFSFLKGTGGDTLRLTPDPLPPMPPATAFVDSSTPVGVNLPGGLSSSIVDRRGEPDELREPLVRDFLGERPEPGRGLRQRAGPDGRSRLVSSSDDQHPDRRAESCRGREGSVQRFRIVRRCPGLDFQYRCRGTENDAQADPAAGEGRHTRQNLLRRSTNTSRRDVSRRRPANTESRDAFA